MTLPFGLGGGGGGGGECGCCDFFVLVFTLPHSRFGSHTASCQSCTARIDTNFPIKVQLVFSLAK